MPLEKTASETEAEEREGVMRLDIDSFNATDVLLYMKHRHVIELGGFRDDNAPYSFIEQFEKEAMDNDYSAEVVGDSGNYRIQWRPKNA